LKVLLQVIRPKVLTIHKAIIQVQYKVLEYLILQNGVTNPLCAIDYALSASIYCGF
jgi:hypothetical protein